MVQQIEDQILSGRLKRGDRLPNERDLAESLEVSRTTVREALRTLEALEIVTVRPGLGPDSGTRISAGTGTALASLIRLQVALDHFSAEGVIEARAFIEAWAAESASQRRSSADIERLQRLVDEMFTGSATGAEFHGLDTQFHLSIARASGNRLVLYFMESMRDAIMDRMHEAFEAAGWERSAGRARREHQALLDAIVRGDAEAAGSIAGHHISGFYGDAFRSARSGAGDD